MVGATRNQIKQRKAIEDQNERLAVMEAELLEVKSMLAQLLKMQIAQTGTAMPPTRKSKKSEAVNGEPETA